MRRSELESSTSSSHVFETILENALKNLQIRLIMGS
jgi:hypothetical protein